ncbi:hypothetical protein [Ramlibacter alkalitolerans]|uniref:Uncharacterized protein n=1 Tax=Ramlibacter alkalitolerans TaxID=2039631 RepID=A0ABS1JT93_9BURK|nr:hypothetical protein [Ramlibacter alkalitolerans]MBL0426795.1 hypothetical protein [Ramlibacter alkalitolerans]
MTLGPVTAGWLLSQTGLDLAGASELITALQAQGALERIDLGWRVPAEPAVKRVPLSPVARLRGRLAQRFAWKQALAATIVCLGVSAALDHRMPADLGTLALPNLPAVSG